MSAYAECRSRGRRAKTRAGGARTAAQRNGGTHKPHHARGKHVVCVPLSGPAPLCEGNLPAAGEARCQPRAGAMELIMLYAGVSVLGSAFGGLGVVKAYEAYKEHKIVSRMVAAEEVEPPARRMVKVPKAAKVEALIAAVEGTTVEDDVEDDDDDGDDFATPVVSESEEEEEEVEVVEEVEAEPPPKAPNVVVLAGAAVGLVAALFFGLKVQKSKRRTRVVTSVQRWWREVQTEGMSDSFFSVSEAFGYLDENGDGSLEPDEIRHVLKNSGNEPLSAESVEALVNLVDVNKDGDISYAEFDEYFSSSFFVKPGDTLIDISVRLTGTSDCWEEIAAHNHLDDPRNMRAGILLKIPDNLMKEIMTSRGLEAATTTGRKKRATVLTAGQLPGL